MRNPDNLILIAVSEAEARINPADTLEARLLAAMDATRDHWLLTDEDARFRAAVCAVMVGASPEEQERIRRELDGLRMLGSGLPISLGDFAETMRDPIGLVRLWKEGRAPAAGPEPGRP